MPDLISQLAGATWRDALGIGTRALDPAAADSAAGDARRLLVAVLGITSLDLVKHPDRRLLPAEADALTAALRRRSLGEPVSRITGTRGFYGRDFLVTSATLDPRPETETLIDAALDLMGPSHPRGAGLDILDIGTGTGCILLTLLAEWPLARGWAVDPSPSALAVAAANARRLGVDDRATFIEGREFAGLDRRFPLILSNPPYIPAGNIAGLATEVRDHDPRLALDGGADGLEIYRQIAKNLPRHATTGWTLLEIGSTQAEEVACLIKAALHPPRLHTIRTLSDMAGLPRCVAIQTLD